MILLGILLLIVVLGLNFLGIQAGKIFKDGAALVCESKRNMVRAGKIPYKTDKVNVLFMGTSRILAGINPILFDQLSGERTFSYNLALPALPIGSSYFVLKDYLTRNPPPDFIIMQLYINRCRDCRLFNYYSSQGLTDLSEIHSLFLNSPSKRIILNYFFPYRMYKYFITKYLYHMLCQPSELKLLIKRNTSILERMKKERGYYFIEEQALSPNNQLPDDYNQNNVAEIQKSIEYNPFTDPYVEKFFDLTQERKIRVILIQPVYRINQCLQYEEIPQQFLMIMNRYEHVIAAQKGWNLKFYENQFFADQTHLNRKGAQKYTQEIYLEFKEIISKNGFLSTNIKEEQEND